MKESILSLIQEPYSVLTIRSISKLTDDFYVFVFEDGHGLQYEAGQFLTLVHQQGEKEIRRSYSITSSPVLKEPLSIGVKRVANGIFSRWLIDFAKIGDQFITSGTGGFFRLPVNFTSHNSFIFFAAGSGITPIYSLIKTLLHLDKTSKIYLLYSNRSPADTIFYDSLNEIQEKYSGKFQVEYLFSTSQDIRKAYLNRDYIIRFLKQYEIDVSHSLFYTCGSEAYMRMIIFVLQLQGVSRNNIRREDFVPGKVIPAKKIPPDTNDHFVILQFHDRAFKIKVTYPDTILQAAKKEKLILPYSCETGICGNCAALCISGKVWLSYNEVLTEQELEKGITLTCVGHPVHGDVILKMDNFQS